MTLEVDMNFKLDFNEDAFKRKILEAARAKSEEHVLNIAREIQQEMGEEGAGLTFSFDQSHGGSLDDSKAELGKLGISGPQSACDAFKKRFQERMRK
jgi:hypothetical protein